MQYICKYIIISKNISYQTYFQLVSPWLHYYQLTHYATWWFELSNVKKQVKELDPLFLECICTYPAKTELEYIHIEIHGQGQVEDFWVHVAFSHQKNTSISNKYQASITL